MRNRVVAKKQILWKRNLLRPTLGSGRFGVIIFLFVILIAGLSLMSEARGACCMPDGFCWLAASQASCESEDGTWLGDGSTCDECTAVEEEEGPPEERGACCLPGGYCVEIPEARCLRCGGIPQGIGTYCRSTDCSIAEARDAVKSWQDRYPENPLVIVITSGNDDACTEWLMDTLVKSEALGDCPHLVVDASVLQRLDIESGGFIIASERTRQQLGDTAPMKWISSDAFPGCPGGENAGPGQYQQIGLDMGYTKDLKDWARDMLGSNFGPGVDIEMQVGFFSTDQSTGMQQSTGMRQVDPLNQLNGGFSAYNIFSVGQDDWSDAAGFGGGGSEVGSFWGWVKKAASAALDYACDAIGAAIGAAIGGAIGGPGGLLIGAVIGYGLKEGSEAVLDSAFGDDDDGGKDDDDGNDDYDDDDDDDDDDGNDDDDGKDDDDDDDGIVDYDGSTHPASTSPEGDWETGWYLNWLWQQQVMTEQAIRDIESGKPHADKRDDNFIQIQMWIAQSVSDTEDKEAEAEQHESLVAPRFMMGWDEESTRKYHPVEDPPRHNVAHGAIPYMDVSVNSPAVVSTGYITSLAVELVAFAIRGTSNVVEETFEDPQGNGWDLGWGWEPNHLDSGRSVITGTADERWGNWAWVAGVEHGSQSVLMCDVMLDYGRLQIAYRKDHAGYARYFAWFTGDEMGLTKQVGSDEYVELAYAPVGLIEDQWHELTIRGEGGHLQVAVGGTILLDAVDPNPILSGAVAFETWPHSRASVDNLVVMDLE